MGKSEPNTFICKAQKSIFFVKTFPHKLLCKMVAKTESWLPQQQLLHLLLLLLLMQAL